MRLLVDAQAVIWAVDDPARLSPTAATTLQDPANDLLVSAGTIWEIAIKTGLGKLSLSASYRDWMNQAIADLGLAILPITVDYAAAMTALPAHHKDPFDRLLVAQAQLDGISVISADTQFDNYGITRVW